MSEFKVGEIVDITIRGARVTQLHEYTDDAPEMTVLLDCEAGACRVQLPHHWPMVTVERQAPAEWPPRVGDLWRREDNGELYFAADVSDPEETDVPEIAMVYTHEDYRTSPEGLRARCAGRITLVHREPEPDYEHCGCSHHGDHAGCYADCGCAS